MQRVSFICLAIGVVIMTINSTRGDEPTGNAAQQPAKLAKSVKVEMDYLLYLPENYGQKDSWPLLLFLHGAGERGTDLQLVKRHGPPKLIDQGKNFPMVVVSPQCTEGQWWQATELTALIDAIVEQHNIDERRIYVTGLSMGGFGTWSLAAYTPHRFAAVAPICGGGETYLVKRFPHLPVWVFHGAKDSVVPLQRSKEMVEALEKAGGNVELTVYPKAGHDSWTKTYQNPDLYEWLLEHQREERK